MVDVMTPGSLNQKRRGAFLQWRPIIYVTKNPSITNSSEIVAYNLANVSPDSDDDDLMDSLPLIYHGDDIKNCLIERIVVSMGSSQDGFYKKTNYTSW